MIPDNPGGGTVNWTNPWGEHRYLEDIETREDGGTPGFLQTIRTALAVQLKEEMGVKQIHDREEEIINEVFEFLSPIENLKILAEQHHKRLGVFSFYIDDLHYNLGVKLLNDRFGIQTTTDQEVRYICESIEKLAIHFKEWAEDYSYDMPTNEFLHKSFHSKEKDLVRKWFNLDA